MALPLPGYVQVRTREYLLDRTVGGNIALQPIDASQEKTRLGRATYVNDRVSQLL